MPLGITIKGLQETQRANLANIAAMQPTGVFGLAIKNATIQAHAYEAFIIHVDTGALKSSRHITINGLEGKVFTDPGAVGPKGIPAIYGYYEHNRGGDHAFAERTVREAGPMIAGRAEETLIRGLR